MPEGIWCESFSVIVACPVVRDFSVIVNTIQSWMILTMLQSSVIARTHFFGMALFGQIGLIGLIGLWVFPAVT
jgi:hypothetical protein